MKEINKEFIYCLDNSAITIYRRISINLEPLANTIVPALKSMIIVL